MHYNVAQLLKEPVGSSRAYRIDESTPDDDGATFISPHGQLSLMRTHRGIWASGQFELGVWGVCSRCLQRFRSLLSIAMDEEYLPTVEVNTGQPLRVPEKAEGSFTIDQRHVLDLSEALRQYTIASQAMKPLCRQDCLGLCTLCGIDKNQSTCSCQGGALDPRWTPLADLPRTGSH